MGKKGKRYGKSDEKVQQSRGKVQCSQEKVQCCQDKVQRKYEKVCQSELSAGGTQRDVENTPKCTCLNCILSRRSSLGPPPVGRHRTYVVKMMLMNMVEMGSRGDAAAADF